MSVESLALSSVAGAPPLPPLGMAAIAPTDGFARALALALAPAPHPAGGPELPPAVMAASDASGDPPPVAIVNGKPGGGGAPGPDDAAAPAVAEMAAGTDPEDPSVPPLPPAVQTFAPPPGTAAAERSRPTIARLTARADTPSLGADGRAPAPVGTRASASRGRTPAGRDDNADSVRVRRRSASPVIDARHEAVGADALPDAATLAAVAVVPAVTSQPAAQPPARSPSTSNPAPARDNGHRLPASAIDTMPGAVAVKRAGAPRIEPDLGEPPPVAAALPAAPTAMPLPGPPATAAAPATGPQPPATPLPDRTRPAAGGSAQPPAAVPPAPLPGRVGPAAPAGAGPSVAAVADARPPHDRSPLGFGRVSPTNGRLDAIAAGNSGDDPIIDASRVAVAPRATNETAAAAPRATPASEASGPMSRPGPEPVPGPSGRSPAATLVMPTMSAPHDRVALRAGVAPMPISPPVMPAASLQVVPRLDGVAPAKVLLRADRPLPATSHLAPPTPLPGVTTLAESDQPVAPGPPRDEGPRPPPTAGAATPLAPPDPQPAPAWSLPPPLAERPAASLPIAGRPLPPPPPVSPANPLDAAMAVASERLGLVRIGLAGGPGDLRLAMALPHAEAATTLAEAAPQLVADLAQQGVRLESLSISAAPAAQTGGSMPGATAAAAPGDATGLAGGAAGQGATGGPPSQGGQGGQGGQARPFVPPAAPAVVVPPRAALSPAGANPTDRYA